MEKKILKVIITIGIPASGKSTWSLSYIKKNPNFARINRDSFRLMLRDEQMCEPKVENIITKLSLQAIDALLAKNINVILDNTHLKKDVIKEIVDYVKYRADVEFMVFDVSLDKAIERDAARPRPVGEEVVKKMFKNYKILMDSFDLQNVSKVKHVFVDPPFDPKLPSIVIFDIDGTLAHMNGKRGPFEWHNVDRDDLDRTVAEQFRDHMTLGHRIFVLSGRDESCRKLTSDWLDFYGLKYEKLLMRKEGDFRADNLVKEEIYNHYIKGSYNVRVIYDDREQVVRMWRSLGLKVFQVEKGDF